MSRIASLFAVLFGLCATLLFAETPGGNIPLKFRYFDASTPIPLGGQRDQKEAGMWVADWPINFTGEPVYETRAFLGLGVTYKRDPDKKENVLLNLRWKIKQRASNELWHAATSETDVTAVNPVTLDYEKLEMPATVSIKKGVVHSFWLKTKNFFAVAKFEPSILPDVFRVKVTPAMAAALNKKARHLIFSGKPLPFNSLQARCVSHWPSTPELEEEYKAEWAQIMEAMRIAFLKKPAEKPPAKESLVSRR